MAVTINGVTYEGNNVSMINNRIIIDGKEVGETEKSQTQVVIEGNIRNLQTDKSVTVNGNIDGDVGAGGSINCDDVGGNVHAGGSVNCDDVGGNVSAGGSVNHG